MMYKILILLCTFSAFSVQAQLEAVIRMDHQQYLLHEPILGRLIIKNTSGRDLEFKPDQFTFFGKIYKHQRLGRLNDKPITESIIIPAGERREATLDFSQIFRVRDAGPYTFSGRIEYYGRTINLPLAYVDIVSGVEILSLDTMADGETGPTHRNIRLVSMMRSGEIRLFLSIKDPIRHLSYGVYELGPQLAQGKPKLELGKENELHILHRSAPAQYMHSVFTLNGTPVSQDVYEAGGVPPEIRRDRMGHVSVLGGKVEASGEQRIRPFTLD